MRLNGAKRIIKTRFFPLRFKRQDDFKFETFIGLGGNVGNTKARFNKFIRVLKTDKRFHIVQTSIILENEAFGYKNQPDFLNAVINLQTSLGASSLLKVMQYYEFKFKRKRSFKNSPRTLDLDILYFSKKVRKSDKLEVPHRGVDERLSVIIPIGLMRSY